MSWLILIMPLSTSMLNCAISFGKRRAGELFYSNRSAQYQAVPSVWLREWPGRCDGTNRCAQYKCSVYVGAYPCMSPLALIYCRCCYLSLKVCVILCHHLHYWLALGQGCALVLTCVLNTSTVHVSRCPFMHDARILTQVSCRDVYYRLYGDTRTSRTQAEKGCLG